MNKLVLSVAALLAGLVSLSAHAATQTSAFNVVINLTPACKITTAPGNITLAYAAGQATATTSSTSFVLQCSKTLPYTVGVSTALVLPGIYSGTATNTQLAYTLAMNTTGVTPGTFPGTDTPVASADGLADTWYIFANIAAGQFGTNGSNTDTIAYNAIVSY